MSDQTPPPELPGVTHRFVDVPGEGGAPGVRLHLAEAGREHAGSGPSLVLLHGWPQHFWCWREVIPRLSRRHHVVAVDLRGHGFSDAPAPAGDTYDKRVLADEIARLIGVLGLDRPVLVGHDWGGWISLLVAGRAPGRTRGVVATAILAPWTRVPRKELRRFLYQVVAGGPLGTLAHRALGQAFLRLVFRLGSYDRRARPEAELAPFLERYRHRERAAAGRAMYARFLRAEMPAIFRRTYQAPVTDVPILLLPGERDGALAPHLVERALGPANLSFATIPNAGHWVPEEQPDALCAHVEDFVTRVSGHVP